MNYSIGVLRCEFGKTSASHLQPRTRALLDVLRLKGAIAVVVVLSCCWAGMQSTNPIWVVVATILLSVDAWPRLCAARALALAMDEAAHSPRIGEETTSLFGWVVQANITANFVYSGVGWGHRNCRERLR